MKGFHANPNLVVQTGLHSRSHGSSTEINLSEYVAQSTADLLPFKYTSRHERADPALPNLDIGPSQGP